MINRDNTLSYFRTESCQVLSYTCNQLNNKWRNTACFKYGLRQTERCVAFIWGQ